MKRSSVRAKSSTLDKVLALAEAGPVRIVAANGHAFVVEKAEDFEKEVERLGKSKRFRRFLNKRSKEPATTTLANYRRSLD